jgi:hypothetical protein
VMTQIPSPPAALDPNEILETFLVAEEFHFLKSAATPPIPSIDS